MRFISKHTEDFETCYKLVVAWGIALVISSLIMRKYMSAGGNALLVIGFILGRSNGVGWSRSIKSDEAIFTSAEVASLKADVDSVAEKDDYHWDGFDEADEKYPIELDIALQAWRAVSNSAGTGPIREQLTGWVNKAYPDLSSIAVTRIVGVCNWDKKGGRPSSNG